MLHMQNGMQSTRGDAINGFCILQKKKYVFLNNKTSLFQVLFRIRN